MAKKLEVYKCDICGNIVEVLTPAQGLLICCGQPMEHLIEQKDNEKHTPIIEKTNNGVKIIVGQVIHPMEELHYIKWIEIITENKIFRKNLKSTDKPEVEFNISKDKILKVREYCSVHNLWSN